MESAYVAWVTIFDELNGIFILFISGVVNAFDLDGLGNARRSCFSVKEVEINE